MRLSFWDTLRFFRRITFYFSFPRLPEPFLLVLGGIIFISVSCNAPRNNPLDIENPDAVLGVLSGSVQTVSLPRTALVNVSIIKNGTVIGTTNSSGRFDVNYIVPEDGWISFQKSGFVKDSVYLSWAGKKSMQMDVYMYQNLGLDSLCVYSSVRNTLIPETKLFISARIVDNDNYLNQDSVFVECADLNYKGRLTYSNKFYSRSINEVDLGVTNLNEALGLTFTIKAKDKSNRLFELGSARLERLLEDAIIIQSPKYDSTAEASPVLSWYEFSAKFKYTELVEVYSIQDGFIIGPVWQRERIPEDSLSVTVDKILPAGNYMWFVWCVDNFSNRISSSPATFVIK